MSYLGWGIEAFVGVESFELRAECRVLLQYVQHPASFFLCITLLNFGCDVAVQQGLEPGEP